MFRCVPAGAFRFLARISLNESAQVGSISTGTIGLASKKNPAINLELREEKSESGKPKQRTKTLDFKQKVYLKDVNGEILGLKTITEANQLAKKQHCRLELDVTIKKIPTYRMINSRKLDEAELRASDSETSKSKHKSSKHMTFTSNVSKHDLETKINQVKRFVAKGHVVVIKVSSSNHSSRDNLVQIDKEFEEIFHRKNGCKVNQKRITDVELKLNVVPVDLLAIRAAFAEVNDQHDEIRELENLDPNKLLTDESILEKLSENPDKT